MKEIQMVTEPYTDALNYKGTKISLSRPGEGRSPLVALDYCTTHGLRAFVYEDPNPESEPTIIELNQYLKGDQTDV